ncbi:MAG: hypothetical protein IKC69_02800, partial [Clostridia bacterium]|nr:hypothetical protein [Clostridia bacterium]
MSNSEEKIYEKAPHPDLLSQLEAIPVAKPGMRPEELRTICLDFMRLQLSFQWLPGEDYHYVIESRNHPVDLKKGSLHGGMPYVNIGTGNVYRFAEYYDPETGSVDLSDLKQHKEIVGIACSGAATCAWSRCISSARLGFTFDMTQKNGFVNVGPYKYSKELKKFIRPIRGTDINPEIKYTPKHVCLENGMQTMYESYAKMLPADGILNSGHIRMCASVPTVIRKNDGTIDGERSFVLYCDQVLYESAWYHDRYTEEGDFYRVHGGVDVKESFANLFRDGYIPFTFKEFLGEADVKKAKINANITQAALSVEELKKVEIRSNYPVSDLFTEVTDPEGNVLYKHVCRRRATTPAELDLYEMALADHIPLDELKPFEASGENSLVIMAQLWNGKKERAYAARLMPGKCATKVYDTSMPEALAAIPLAKPGMKPEELRKICLDFMKLQLSFQWMPSDDHEYIVESKKHECTLEKGHLYGGVPYITVGSGSLYRFLEFFDPETGEVDMTEFKKHHVRIFGNACSGGASTSWARCISSARLAYTGEMTQGNGYVNVGPYTYPKNFRRFQSKRKLPGYYTPKTVCQENGEQTMYESYALIQPADGLLCNGHIRLAGSNATVVRNEDGTINGEKSWMLYCDQGCFTSGYSRHHAHATPDGDHYFVQGGVDVKVTFKRLFLDGYIPFTFKEFLGEAEVQLPEVKANIVQS